MKFQIQHYVKLFYKTWFDFFYFKFINTFIYSFFLFSFLPGIHAQQTNEQIDRQRIKIKEALIKDIFVLSTTLVEANKEVPKHLAVRGYTMPNNHFIIRLPVDDWNGKNFVAGCGGGCGELPMEVFGTSKVALQKKYATALYEYRALVT